MQGMQQRLGLLKAFKKVVSDYEYSENSVTKKNRKSKSAKKNTAANNAGEQALTDNTAATVEPDVAVSRTTESSTTESETAEVETTEQAKEIEPVSETVETVDTPSKESSVAETPGEAKATNVATPTITVSKPMTSTANPSVTPSNKTVWLGLAVVAVIAIGGSGVVWQQGQQQQLQLQTDIKAALQRVDQQSESARGLQRELDRVVANANQQQQQNDEAVRLLKRQLQSQQQRLQSLSTTDRNDWLLAEAEYLIRLANQRLLMGKEVAGALDLLNAADDIARELDDTALFSVREALAKDMAALRQVSKFDSEGIYLELGALADQAEQLRLFEMPELQFAPIESFPESATLEEKFWIGLKSARERLKSYVQYDGNRDEAYKPLLGPEFEPAVRQNVHLMFEQSQMALLAGNQRLYVASLSKAKEWLVKYYTLDRDKAQGLVVEIDRMISEKVAVELPDISGSLRELKRYVELIHDVKKEKPKQSEVKLINEPGVNQ